MKTVPTIDVIIPVFNGEYFIEKALRSVDRQTCEPSRIIVVDDGSTDKTEEIVLAFKSASAIPVEYIKQENRGPNAARNKGISVSSGELLAFLDTDDVWEPAKLEKQLAVFNGSEWNDLGLVYCAYSLIAEDDSIIIDKSAVTLDPSYRGHVFDKVLEANKIMGSASAVLIKKECFDSVGLFDESLKASEDWDMWIRIAEKYAIDYVNEPLVKIRRHPGNFQKKYEYMLVNDILFFNKWIERLPKDKVPKRWKNTIATLVFLGLPSLHFLPIAKAKLLKYAARQNVS